MSTFSNIAITGAGLAFLGGVLFPILQPACGYGGNARRASCMSNMKQLGLAISQYTQDSDGILPAYAKNVRGSNWRETIYPFVKSTGVYQCPDDQRRPAAVPIIGAMPQSYTGNHIGADNRLQERGAFAAPGALPSAIRTFRDLGKTILLVDSRSQTPEWNITNPTFLPGSGQKLYVHFPRHIFYEHPFGLINIAFLDGHVKSMKPQATLTPINLWTRDNSPFSSQDAQNAQTILKHAEQE